MDKIFVGSVKEMINDYGTMYSLGFKKEDMDKLVYNDKGFANLTLKKSQKGTWYMEVYKPKNRAPKEEETKEEELPF